MLNKNSCRLQASVIICFALLGHHKSRSEDVASEQTVKPKPYYVSAPKSSVELIINRSTSSKIADLDDIQAIFSAAARSGQPTVTLVCAETIRQAIRATSRLYDGGGWGGHVEFTNKSRKIWLVAFAGNGSSPMFSLDKIEVVKKTIRLKLLPREQTGAVSFLMQPHLFWIDLGELPVGVYEVHLDFSDPDGVGDTVRKVRVIDKDSPQK